MSDTGAFGFGKFIPGFDFLQNLAQSGKAAPGMPPLSSWVAPTVSVEDISKRIEELKAVQFWLEQNSRALAATVQALEVQKMTLTTLQGMNVSMADLAKSFGSAGPAKAPQAADAKAATAASAGANADWPMSSKKSKSGASAADVQGMKADFASKKMAESAPEATPQAPKPAADAAASSAVPPGMGDPMMWWGALSQQFQHIASQAMQDPAQQQAMAKATHMATDFTKAAMQAATTMVRSATEGVKAPAAPAKKASARKPKAAATAQPARAAAPRPTAATAAVPRKAAAKRTTARKAAGPSTAKVSVVR